MASTQAAEACRAHSCYGALRALSGPVTQAPVPQPSTDHGWHRTSSGGPDQIPGNWALPENQGQEPRLQAAGHWKFAILLRKKQNLYKKGQSVPAVARGEACVLSVLLLDEGVGDGLHAVLWADEHHRGAPAYHQAQLARVLGELVLVVGVCEEGQGVRRCWAQGGRRQGEGSPWGGRLCGPESKGRCWPGSGPCAPKARAQPRSGRPRRALGTAVCAVLLQ